MTFNSVVEDRTPQCEHNFNIIPKPNRLIATDGWFVLDPTTVIVSALECSDEAQVLADCLAATTGFRLERLERSTGDGSRIKIRLDEALSALGVEGYALTVTPSTITMASSGRAGLFYAVQSLLQLLPPTRHVTSGHGGAACEIPCVVIDDSPRFSWRGAMLDVSRHFMPLEFLYKFVDTLSMHKINVLQLHLCDDQGWRIEIKKYPKLTEIGSVRRRTMVGVAKACPARAEFDPSAITYDDVPHTGFYTQAEMRALVAYAGDRHITIVPEIEMPGHAQAAVAAYPELGCVDTPYEVSPHWGIYDVLFNPTEETIGFLKDVLAEVLEIFPSPFIHIGGDEAVKKQWRASAAVQARIAELGLRDEAHLQSYLIERIDTFLTANGRRLIGWDEILEGGLAHGAVVMSWRGEKGGIAAAAEGHDVVMAPYQFTYFDYYQSKEWDDEPTAFPSTLLLETVYGYEPIPADLPASQRQHVLGAQGQLWTEYMPDEQQVEYQAFPRLCALAEVTWTERDTVDFDGFLQRLAVHEERLAAMGVGYRPHPPGESLVGTDARATTVLPNQSVASLRSGEGEDCMAIGD